MDGCRVARWYIFRPKIAILVNLGGSCNGRYFYIFVHLVYFDIVYGHVVGIFCGNLVYFPPFWYIVPRKIWQPWADGSFRLRVLEMLKNGMYETKFFDPPIKPFGS
jgi:hypothetical protein